MVSFSFFPNYCELLWTEDLHRWRKGYTERTNSPIEEDMTASYLFPLWFARVPTFSNVQFSWASDLVNHHTYANWFELNYFYARYKFVWVCDFPANTGQFLCICHTYVSCFEKIRMQKLHCSCYCSSYRRSIFKSLSSFPSQLPVKLIDVSFLNTKYLVSSMFWYVLNVLFSMASITVQTPFTQ